MYCMLYVLVVGLFEYKIWVILFDIGGGFGNKVLIYFGYVCVIVVLLLLDKLVKWMEDCSENLMFIGFVCDYIMVGEIVVNCDGKILVIWFNVLVDYGVFNV